ncbi:MAG: hypothetical protein RIQ93_2085 [Verrucomicrobiota bacterium]|jgi:hypothetical protein
MNPIDIPEFDEALANDRDGTFHRAVEAHLIQAAADLRTETLRGLSPLEFAQATQIETALEKGLQVIRFSAHLSQSQ